MLVDQSNSRDLKESESKNLFQTIFPDCPDKGFTSHLDLWTKVEAAVKPSGKPHPLTKAAFQFIRNTAVLILRVKSKQVKPEDQNF